MALVTDAFRVIAHADADLTVVELAERLDRAPQEVAGALSVLKAQGLVGWANNRVGLTKLGHRCVPVAS
jgi:predicted transcriptional regulator